jgi:hypothetical protein
MKLSLENFRKTRGKIYFSKDHAYSTEKVLLDSILEKQKEVASSMKVTYSWKELIIP